MGGWVRCFCCVMVCVCEQLFLGLFARLECLSELVKFMTLANSILHIALFTYLYTIIYTKPDVQRPLANSIVLNGEIYFTKMQCNTRVEHKRPWSLRKYALRFAALEHLSTLRLPESGL